MPAPPTPKRVWRPFVVGVLVATLSLTAVQLVAARWNSEPATGGLKVETTPAGADVIVDGQRRGVTPLTLSLAPGSHAMTVRLGGKERSMPVAVTAGGVISQYFELIPATPPAVATGGQRAAAQDSPVKEPLPPRATTGSPESRGEAGVSAARAAAPATGWLTVAAPFAVQVMEDGQVVGISTTPRIVLSPGRHDLVLVNRARDYSETTSVRIPAGGGTMIRVDPRQ